MTVLHSSVQQSTVYVLFDPTVLQHEYFYLSDDQFSGRVFGVTELLSETQREAVLRRIAAVRTEVVQL